jgi:antitoxin component of MazEF toxin-antitoxin module
VKWVHKICLNGDSASINLPRKLMFRLDLRPGEFVELTHDDDSETFSVRPWGVRENGTRRSPGQIPELPGMKP